MSPIKNWNVSNVSNMEYLFYNCKIDNLNPISNWDVSNVTNMNFMFGECRSLTNTSGINNWDITNVTSFYRMFSECPTHPEFTKVTGTWDSTGSFTPTTK